MGEGKIRFDDGAAYERMMGTWSRLAGAIFLDWLAPSSGLRWIDVAKVFGECIARDFRDRTRHFNTGRATADDNERHCRLARRFVFNFFRVFER